MLLNDFSRVGKWLFWQFCAEGSLANAPCHTLSGKEFRKNRKSCALDTLFLTKGYTRTDTPWSPPWNNPKISPEPSLPDTRSTVVQATLPLWQLPNACSNSSGILDFLLCLIFLSSMNKYTVWIRVHALQIESNIQITANSVQGAWEWKDTTVPAGRVEARFTILEKFKIYYVD